MIYSPTIYVKCDGPGCEADITYQVKLVSRNQFETLTDAMRSIISENLEWTIVAVDRKTYCPKCASHADYLGPDEGMATMQRLASQFRAPKEKCQGCGEVEVKNGEICYKCKELAAMHKAVGRTFPPHY